MPRQDAVNLNFNCYGKVHIPQVKSNALPKPLWQRRFTCDDSNCKELVGGRKLAWKPMVTKKSQLLPCLLGEIKISHHRLYDRWFLNTIRILGTIFKAKCIPQWLFPDDWSINNFQIFWQIHKTKSGVDCHVPRVRAIWQCNILVQDD